MLQAMISKVQYPLPCPSAAMHLWQSKHSFWKHFRKCFDESVLIAIVLRLFWFRKCPISDVIMIAYFEISILCSLPYTCLRTCTAYIDNLSKRWKNVLLARGLLNTISALDEREPLQFICFISWETPCIFSMQPPNKILLQCIYATIK